MIGTAAAIIGSAVLGAGATMLASHNAADAAQQSGQLQYQASQDSIAAQQRMYDQTRADNEPFRQVGVSAASALAGGFGLGAPSMTGAQIGSTPVPNVGGVSMTGRTGVPTSPLAGAPASAAAASGPDYQAYWDANPDLAASTWLAGTNPGDLTGDGVVNNLDLAAEHYRDFGRTEGRALPMTTPAAPAPVDPNAPPAPYVAPPGYTDPTAPTGYTVGPRPDVGPQPAAYTAPARPTAGAAPVRPTMAPLDVSMTAFTPSPDFQFRLDQGNKALGNVASSMHGVMSGARLKAADRYNQDYATTAYDDWRAFTAGQYNTEAARSDANYGVDLGQYNTTTNRGDLNYSTDRAFNYGQTQDALGQFNTNRAVSNGIYADDRANTQGRYDTRNTQLMALAGFGTGANAANAGAASSFAANQGNALMTGAQAQGNAAIQGANAWTSGINNLVTTGAYLGGRLMTGGTGAAAGTGYGGGYGYNPNQFLGGGS